jgi:hypothetical protein
LKEIEQGLTIAVPILHKYNSVRFKPYFFDLQKLTQILDSNVAFIPRRTSQRTPRLLPVEKHSSHICRVKKYGLTMLVSSDDQVKAYIKKIMSQLDKWMIGGKISKLVVVITNKDTGEHVERWQFDVRIHPILE